MKRSDARGTGVNEKREDEEGGGGGGEEILSAMITTVRQEDPECGCSMGVREEKVILTKKKMIRWEADD